MKLAAAYYGMVLALGAIAILPLTADDKASSPEANARLALGRGFTLLKSGNYKEAQEHLETALKTYQELYPVSRFPDGHAQTAAAFEGLGLNSIFLGRYEHARQHLQNALEMRMRLYPKSKYPDGHPALAKSLERVGSVMRMLGKPNQAQPFLEQALRMHKQFYAESTDPLEQQRLVDSLEQLGGSLKEQSKLLEARQRNEEALEIARDLAESTPVGSGHRRLARVLSNLGSICQAQGDYIRAQKYLGEVRTTLLRVFPPEKYPQGHLDLASNLNSLGVTCLEMGDLDDALSYFELGLEMYRKLYPEDRYPLGHPFVATALGNVSIALRRKGRYVQAMRGSQQRLAMARSLFSLDRYPNGHPGLAVPLVNLASDLCRLGEYHRAHERVREAAKMLEQLYPKERYPNGHPYLVDQLQHLAQVMDDMGQIDEARTCSESCLAMLDRLYPVSDFPHGRKEKAEVLHLLGGLLWRQGERKQGLELIGQSLEMYKRLYPAESYPSGHPKLANACLNHASALFQQEEYEQALLNLRRGGEMVRGMKSLPALVNYFRRSGKINLLAGARMASARRTRLLEIAEKNLESALKARKLMEPISQFPNGTVGQAELFDLLGDTFYHQANYASAQEHYQNALGIRMRLYPKEQFPNGHHRLATSYARLGDLMLVQGNHEDSRNFFGQAATIMQKFNSEFLGSLSEAEALNYLARQKATRDALITLCLELNSPKDELYPFLWHGAGAVQRTLARRQKALITLKDPSAQESYEQYLSVRTTLANLVLAPAEAEPDRQKVRRIEIERLTREKEQLERKLALFASQLPEDLLRTPPNHTDLLKNMAPGMAFIDFYRYNNATRGDPSLPPSARTTPDCYIAFVSQPGSPIALVDLGQAAPIDAAIEQWRKAIVTGDDNESATQVRDLLWQPLEAGLADSTSTVFIRPDARLTSVPWGAQPGDRRGSILLQKYAFAVVASGIHLAQGLRKNDPSTNQRSRLLLAVGNVDFQGAPTDEDEKELASSKPAHVKSLAQWPALPGTKKEIDDLIREHGNGDVIHLDGAQANTTRVMNELPKVRWAHLATHGFFADPKLRSALRVDENLFASADSPELNERTTFAARNPLVLSGLVLAGAGLPRKKGPAGISIGDGGILTAESIAAHRLSNLELVVLSACETGLGDVADGEGVYGLQRAFHIAGAKTVVASLWKVDDQATAALMRLFYHKLWTEKKPPIVALRESQLALYRYPDKISELSMSRGPQFSKVIKTLETEPNVAAPKVTPTRLWAAFVLSGASASDTRQDAPFRKWTDSTGSFSVQAQLIEIELNAVVLRKANGALLTVPLTRLSDSDRQYVEARRS